ncbi:MAG TPA: YraN family protein [Steroidobacteraceae bacterium]|jgi:putative endonuclease|nr:YraN family protein [Steroidobacteraceae bacterium]
MTNHGQASEQLAVEYLQTQGVLILARNLRCKAGELDLVALDGDVLAVIEVRQRGGTRFGGAPASVTRHKQRKIIRAAGYFLQRRMQWRSRLMRFDVFAVQGPPDGPHRMLWLKDAFRAT